MRLFLALFGSLLAAVAAGQVSQQPQRGSVPATATGQARPRPAPASAPEKAAASPDEVAIEANDAAFIKAFNAGDPDAIAATFAENAEVIDEEGTIVEGRPAIAAMFAATFQASPGATIALKTHTLKFLGPDTAVLRGRAEVVPAKDQSGEPESSRYTVIFIKRNGTWLQASSRDEYDQPSSANEKLKELEWLVGDWVSESEDSVVFTTCSWAENKNFLLRSFTVHLQGRSAMTGQQRIGWDPVSRQFKSWVFDSEGGYGEGFWTRDGDRWLIKATGVRHDGKHASATQVITRVNNDMIRWKSVDRTIGNKIDQNVDEFVLVRKPPKPR